MVTAVCLGEPSMPESTSVNPLTVWLRYRPDPTTDRPFADPQKRSRVGHRPPDCRICGHSILIGSNILDSEVRRCFYGFFGGSVGGNGGFFFSLNKSTFQNIEGRLRFSQTHPAITQNIKPVKHPKNSFMTVSLV